MKFTGNYVSFFDWDYLMFEQAIKIPLKDDEASGLSGIYWTIKRRKKKYYVWNND